MRRSFRFGGLFAYAVLAGCASAESPELACQKRLAAVPDAQQVAGDDFHYHGYAKLDRTGCTAKQQAVLNQILPLAKALPALSKANQQAKSEADIAATFQSMNNALIALDDLERTIRVDLEKLEAPQ